VYFQNEENSRFYLWCCSLWCWALLSAFKSIRPLNNFSFCQCSVNETDDFWHISAKLFKEQFYTFSKLTCSALWLSLCQKNYTADANYIVIHCKKSRSMCNAQHCLSISVLDWKLYLFGQIRDIHAPQPIPQHQRKSSKRQIKKKTWTDLFNMTTWQQ